MVLLSHHHRWQMEVASPRILEVAIPWSRANACSMQTSLETYMGSSINGDTPIAGWFRRENPVWNGWFGGTPVSNLDIGRFKCKRSDELRVNSRWMMYPLCHRLTARNRNGMDGMFSMSRSRRPQETQKSHGTMENSWPLEDDGNLPRWGWVLIGLGIAACGLCILSFICLSEPW